VDIPQLYECVLASTSFRAGLAVLKEAGAFAP